jgi:hypothetical protein
MLTDDIKRDLFLWQFSFLQQITQNHVNNKNTVNHDSLYLHHLRDFEWSAREKNGGENGP